MEQKPNNEKVVEEKTETCKCNKKILALTKEIENLKKEIAIIKKSLKR